MLGSEERGRVGWVRLTAAKSVEAVLRTGKGLVVMEEAFMDHHSEDKTLPYVAIHAGNEIMPSEAWHAST